MLKQAVVKRGVSFFAPLLIVLLMICLPGAMKANAEGGIAISGSFYRQAFEIPQGTTVSGPSIYVVIFNNAQEEAKVRMSTEAPPGVNINLTYQDFSLTPGGQQKVGVEVEVSEDAAPGEYEIAITAEPYQEAEGGISVLGSVRQTSQLTVSGEGAWITVVTESPAGDPIISSVRLFKVKGNDKWEVAYTETGNLHATVAPGEFMAECYVGGQKVAEKSFSVIAGEDKSVILVAETIFFRNFGVVPKYAKKTGHLALAELVFSIENVYQPVNDAEVLLTISHDGVFLEERSVTSMSTLDLGHLESSYIYMPVEGWVNGIYEFKLQLNLAGEPYAASMGATLEVMDVGDGSEDMGNEGEGVSSADEPTDGGLNAIVIGGIVVGVVIAALLVFYVWYRRREDRKSGV